jgi:hypothetical protein
MHTLNNIRVSPSVVEEFKLDDVFRGVLAPVGISQAHGNNSPWQSIMKAPWCGDQIQDPSCDISCIVLRWEATRSLCETGAGELPVILKGDSHQPVVYLILPPFRRTPVSVTEADICIAHNLRR